MPKGVYPRKKGTIRKGSAQHSLSLLEVGEHLWIETTQEKWASEMSRAVVPRSRRLGVMKEREFVARVYTAVGTKVGDIHYLIKVERTQ